MNYLISDLFNFIFNSNTITLNTHIIILDLHNLLIINIFQFISIKMHNNMLFYFNNLYNFLNTFLTF